MYISKNGLDLLKSHEGCRLTAYLDYVGRPTIGYGHTHNVKLGDKISQDQADRYLLEDVWVFERAIEHLVEVTLNQNQFDALVSFTYNVGDHNLETSTLLAKLNNGDYVEAADQFLRWNKADGAVLKGLTKRRKAERELFLKVG